MSTTPATYAPLPADRRAAHQAWLTELTQTPTAAGCEQRVVAWIERWLVDRPALVTRSDPHGNIEIRLAAHPAEPAEGVSPVYFTAHLDHPAFVIDTVEGPRTAIASFRGGVMDDYFADARVRVHPREGDPIEGTVTGRVEPADAAVKEPFKRWRIELDTDATLAARDIAVWSFPDADVRDAPAEIELAAPGLASSPHPGVLFTHACDDLAALAAALSAIDELSRDDAPADARVLLTRAEEVGFIGAIGATRDGFMPKTSRIIALENSRSFPDSPIGGGPIVRVGDRVSTFTPELTGAVAQVAQDIAGRAAEPTASEKQSTAAWPWQRKLMAGGACEASVFCAYGYQATCVCLPLGNYHNMADLAAVQAGTFVGTPRVGPEHIALADFHGMVDLLIACGRHLPERAPFAGRLEKLWGDLGFVLG